MCGRFALALPANEVQQIPGYPAVHVRIRGWIGRDRFVPRYNVAPRSQAPVVRMRNTDHAIEQGDSEISDSRDLTLQTMKWGLVPHWSKSEPSQLNTINARSESLVEGGGMWGSIKGKRRCVVPVQGYYEWAKKGKERLPHFIRHKDGKIMLLAGLYDVAHLEGQSEPLWTFTVVTTAANKNHEWLHDRQPVILVDQNAIDTWLDTSSHQWTKELERLVNPYNESSSPLECYPVPKEVGKVGTESPTFIEPISKRKDGIEAMFTKQKKASESSASGNPPGQSSQVSGTKRKRGLSDPPATPKQNAAVASSGDDIHKAYVGTSQRPTKEATPGDSDIEILSGPPQGSSKTEKHTEKDEDSSPPSSQRSAKKKVKAQNQPGSPRKKVDKVESESSRKITSFFSKG